MRLVALLTVLAASSIANAQDERLLRALEARWPRVQIVPQCMPGGEQRLRVLGGSLCLYDASSGLTLAQRTVAIGGHVGFAMAGDPVFAVGPRDFRDDTGEARSIPTRFMGHAWRWDVARDELVDLGPVEHGFVVQTSFGALIQRRTAHWQLFDGRALRDVTLDRRFGGEGGEDLFEAAGATYYLEGDELLRLELDGDRVRVVPHARLDGSLFRSGATLYGARAREGRIELMSLTLPGNTLDSRPYPPGMSLPFWAWRDRDGTWILFGPEGCSRRCERARFDPARRTLARLDDGPSSWTGRARPVTYLGSREITALIPGRRSIWLAAGGFFADLSPRGFDRSRSDRSGAPPCRCDGEVLVCSGRTVASACAPVRDLERVGVVPATQFTGDGGFRIDRLDAARIRITRLSDGERLWVSILQAPRRSPNTVLLAQRDDGRFFTTDRTVLSGLAVREGEAVSRRRLSALLRRDVVASFFVGG